MNFDSFLYIIYLNSFMNIFQKIKKIENNNKILCKNFIFSFFLLQYYVIKKLIYSNKNEF